MAVAFALAGCASTGFAEGAGTIGPERASRRDRVITAMELRRSSHGMTLDQIVRSLRPSFVLGREGAPVVFVDGQPYGPIDALRLVPPGLVSRIDLLDALAAVRRYGTLYSTPIIAVTTVGR